MWLRVMSADWVCLRVAVHRVCAYIQFDVDTGGGREGGGVGGEK